MRVVSSSGGRIVIDHDDGYSFTFEVHDLEGRALDLVTAEWPASGPPPDADELEAAARAAATAEATAQGWL